MSLTNPIDHVYSEVNILNNKEKLCLQIAPWYQTFYIHVRISIQERHII